MKKNFCLTLAMLMLTVTSGMGSCKEPTGGGPQPPIDIPEGDVTVAAYYFPNWSTPVVNSEWAQLQRATPKFDGHRQPKVPQWGYKNENDPTVMAQKIDAAADNNLDVFIFDWYWFDADLLASSGMNYISGNKYLYPALEQGYMGASNNDRVKFSLMWCNHDVGNVPGAVRPATIESMMDYVIETYFRHPSYWLVDGWPYFSIYQINSFFQSFGNDAEQAAAAIETFRDKVKAAGFPDLHLNGVLFGMPGAILNVAVNKLKLDSTTSYVWIHHNTLPDFPATRYEKAADQYFSSVAKGGGSNGLENAAGALPIPYHINVTMGWDSSPRCGNVTADEWRKRRDYPFGAVMVNNTPYMFKKYLAQAKKLTLQNHSDPKDRIITINSWNEWGEGSYLEPDNVNGTGYLEAIRDVFSK